MTLEESIIHSMFDTKLVEELVFQFKRRLDQGYNGLCQISNSSCERGIKSAVS